jgi:molybdate transport system substrate-binding protein
MSKRWPTPIILISVIVLVVAFPTVSYAQVKVLMSGGFWAPFQEILPEFEKTSGMTVSATRGASQGTAPNTIGVQLRGGAPADVVIMSREGLEELVAEGRIIAGTEIDLAQTSLGVGVRAGAPKPDITTVEAFKQALLRAKSLTVVSTTGIYVTSKLIPQLGIAKEMAGKITNSGLPAVARGDVEIAVQPVSELLHAPGVDFVGTVPEEIQFVSVFTAAIVKGSKEPEASKRLITFLASEKAAGAIKKNGMEPLKSR